METPQELLRRALRVAYETGWHDATRHYQPECGPFGGGPKSVEDGFRKFLLCQAPVPTPPQEGE